MSLIYIFYVHSIYVFLRDISTFMTTQIVPETLPTWIHALVILAVIYGGYLGIEVIARTAEIFYRGSSSLFIVNFVKYSSDETGSSLPFV